jgi:hypothetical protein
MPSAFSTGKLRASASFVWPNFNVIFARMRLHALSNSQLATSCSPAMP